MVCINKKGGYVTLLAVVYTAVLMILAAALSAYPLSFNRLQIAEIARQESLNIAESAMEIQKWKFAHSPDDLNPVDNNPSDDLVPGESKAYSGPYVFDFTDKVGDIKGGYEIAMFPRVECSLLRSVRVDVTGWSKIAPDIKRTVRALYSKPSVAEFSYIIDDNVEAGSDREIFGPYHSNYTVKMEGINHSTVSSSQETCQDGFRDCNGSQGAVYGGGPNSDLWDYPVPTVDFPGLTINFSQAKTAAQSSGGEYYENIYNNGANPSYNGYYIRLKGDEFDIYKVDNVISHYGYNSQEGWGTRWTIPNWGASNFWSYVDQSSVETVQIPDSCALVFVEDDVFIEGTLNKQLTVIAADLESGSNSEDVFLVGDITYGTPAITDPGDPAYLPPALTLAAEKSVTIVVNAPNVMEVSGIFIAQEGRFGRDHFVTSGSTRLPGSLSSHRFKDKLTINGSVVSNSRVGTKWTSGGSLASGYLERINRYTPEISANPPIFTPPVSSEYEFLDWQERFE